MDHPPIIVQEEVQLQQSRLSDASIDALMMNCDRFLCWREKSNEKKLVENGEALAEAKIIICDRNNPSSVTQLPCEATDLAVVSPSGKLLAVYGGKLLRIIDLSTKDAVHSHNLVDDNGQIIFCCWINNDIIAFITQIAVFQWRLSAADDAKPRKVFARDPSTLSFSTISSYETDKTMRFYLLISKAVENSSGSMQLISNSDNQLISDCNVAVFLQFKLEEDANFSTILAFTTFSPTSRKFSLHIRKLTSLPEGIGLNERLVNFELRDADDYPISVHANEAYGVLFIITRNGFVLLYEIDTIACICMHRLETTEQISASVFDSTTSGVSCVDRSGKIFSIRIDEDKIISYMIEQKSSLDLALKFAIRNNTLRHTPQTIQRLRAISILPRKEAEKSTKPLMQQYFDVFLEFGEGKLSKSETLQLCRFTFSAMSRDLAKNNVQKWFDQAKITCSEELAGLIQQQCGDGDELTENIKKRVDRMSPRKLTEKPAPPPPPIHEDKKKPQQDFVEVNENSVLSVDGDADEYEPKTNRADSRLSASNSAAPVVFPAAAGGGAVSKYSTVTFSSSLNSPSSSNSTPLFGGGSLPHSNTQQKYLPFGSTSSSSPVTSTSWSSRFSSSNSSSIFNTASATPANSFLSAAKSTTPTFLPFGSAPTPTATATFSPFIAVAADSSKTSSVSKTGASSGGAGFSFTGWGNAKSSAVTSSPTKQPLAATASSSFDLNSRFPNNSSSMNNLKRKSSAGTINSPSLPSSSSSINNKHQRVLLSNNSGATRQNSSSNGTFLASGERSLFNERAKLYRFDAAAATGGGGGGAGAWKERGVGNIQLIQKPVDAEKKTFRVSCVMHADQTHKLCCNHLVQSQMRCEVVKPLVADERFTQLMWYANDYSSHDSVEPKDKSDTVVQAELRNELFRVRFRAHEQAQRFQRVFEQAVNDAPAATAVATKVTAIPADEAEPATKADGKSDDEKSDEKSDSKIGTGDGGGGGGDGENDGKNVDDISQKALEEDADDVEYDAGEDEDNDDFDDDHVSPTPPSSQQQLQQLQQELQPPTKRLCAVATGGSSSSSSDD